MSQSISEHYFFSACTEKSSKNVCYLLAIRLKFCGCGFSKNDGFNKCFKLGKQIADYYANLQTLHQNYFPKKNHISIQSLARDCEEHAQ